MKGDAIMNLEEIEMEEIIEKITSLYKDKKYLKIKEIFSDNGYDKDFVIHFGDNYFPEKDYRGVHYEAGAYESLVVTIGEGEGDNWWCVLFPPLCLLEASENETGDVECQFFVAKMIEKFFK